MGRIIFRRYATTTGTRPQPYAPTPGALSRQATAGLDPQSRAVIWGHLDDLQRQEAITVFLTTHRLEEAERCDRIAVMDHGHVVVAGHSARAEGCRRSRHRPPAPRSAVCSVGSGDSGDTSRLHDTMIEPTTVPPGSMIADVVSDTATTTPSLPIRAVSCCSHCPLRATWCRIRAFSARRSAAIGSPATRPMISSAG